MKSLHISRADPSRTARQIQNTSFPHPAQSKSTQSGGLIHRSASAPIAALDNCDMNSKLRGTRQPDADGLD